MEKNGGTGSAADLPGPKSSAEYRSMTPDDALAALRASRDGLRADEAQRRLGLFGRNEIATPRKSALVEFLSRFWGPMPWLLELAIVLSLVLGHDLEAVIVAVLIAANAVIGQIHARSSQRSLQLLKERLAVQSTVLRDGTWGSRNAAEVVPGDIVVVQMGDIVPADAKILGGSLSLDQSALTGESLPVDAGESEVIFASSTVRRGQARCLVVNTGTGTSFGRTAELVKMAKPRSHQEQIMLAIVRYMMYLGVAALALVAVDAVLERTGIVTIVTFALTFLMGAVPVALPAVLTIVQAVGAMELVGKGALVTRLDSIEDAASLDVLCLDKTGTLTQNSLSVVEVVPYPGYDGKDVVSLADLTAPADSKDVIDLAIRAHAKDSGIDGGSSRQLSVTPFEPISKRSEAIIQADGQRFRVTKGAPQIVLPLSRATAPAVIQTAEAAVEALSLKGFRILAVARTRGADQDALELAGLLALADPPRPDAARTIQEVKSLGITPLMITGDNIAIARQTAGALGFGDKVLRASELKEIDESARASRLEHVSGVAEVYPEDKYQIVKLLQARDHMVGMTGDGVNDAPALKQAEIGFAVKGATDVAKASATVVLTEPGIRTIVEALVTSRQIYQRMLTWVINKVTKTIQLVGILTLGFFWLHDITVSLLGMALLILSNDFVTMSLATDRVRSTSNPNSWNVKNLTLASAGLGIFFIIEGWLTLLAGVSLFHLSFASLRSLVLLMLVFTSQFRILIVRERRHFWDSLPGRGVLLSSASVIAVFLLLGIFGVLIDPLAPWQVLAVLAFSAIYTFLVEFPKIWLFRRLGL